MLKSFRNIGQTCNETHLGPDGAAQESVGDMLRDRRGEFDLDLRDVSNALRIRFPYLVAIEESRLDDLPGATYAIGFVRAYAEYLGLDGPAVVERYKNETAALADDGRLIFPSPLPEGKVPSGTILLFAVLALAVIYGGWVLLTTDSRRLAELVPALPDQFLALIGMDDAAAPNEAPINEAESTVPAGIASPDASSQTNVATEPMQEATGEMTGGSATSHPKTLQTPQPMKSLTDAASGNAETSLAEQPLATQPVTAEPVPVTPVPVEPDASKVENPAQLNSEASDSANNAEAEVDNQASGIVAPVVETSVVPSTPTVSPEIATPEPQVVETVPPSNEIASPEKISPTENTGPGDELPRSAAPSAQTAAITAMESTLPAPPAAPVEDTNEPRKYGAENTGSRVVIRATGESWVQVRDKEGNLLLTRVLRIGDSYRVPNDTGLVMRTGNAGGLEIQVDGETVPGLGVIGDVLHDVALDADQLKAGTAIRR